MKEIRNINEPITRSGEDSRRVEGYALVFGCDSVDLGGFTERIAPGSLDGVLERSDVLCLLNHNEGRGVLARWRGGEGSLELEVDAKGLRYAFDAPNTQLGDELLEGLKRGDINASSFAFTVEHDTWAKDESGNYIRTIDQFGQLFDVSPVYRPAYNDTSVKADLRGLETLKEEEAAQAQAELDAYYDELEKLLP